LSFKDTFLDFVADYGIFVDVCCGFGYVCGEGGGINAYFSVNLGKLLKLGGLVDGSM
jgi:hypothetical protein